MTYQNNYLAIKKMDWQSQSKVREDITITCIPSNDMSGVMIVGLRMYYPRKRRARHLCLIWEAVTATSF